MAVKIVASMLLLLCQDTQKTAAQESPTQETITVKIPNYYVMTRFVSRREDSSWIKLNPAPEGVKRTYSIVYLNDRGEFIENKNINETEFYETVKRVLNFGVRDNHEFDFFCLNEKFEEFIKLIVDKNIISRGSLKEIAHYYYTYGWVESAYYLDKAFPKIFSKEQWQNLRKDCDSVYKLTLWKIKNCQTKEQLSEILENLDNYWDDYDKYDKKFYFWKSVKAYAELHKNGIDFSYSTNELIFNSYLDFYNYHKNLPKMELIGRIKENYALLNLPLPEKSIINAKFNKLLDENDYLIEDVGKICRNLELTLSKETAKYYRKELLKWRGNNIKNIDYLTSMVGENVSSEEWENYGRINLSAYYRNKKSGENIKEKIDYYHIAVESFRRTGTVQLDDKIKSTLLDTRNDQSIHMRDLIIAYELVGKNPKMDFYVKLFDERAELYEKSKCGINEMIQWNENEYGEKIVPFRDAIELAAYLKNSERTRKLSYKIVRYLEKKSQEKNWEPINAEIEEILNLYESLSFQEGAYSLAMHLYEAGFLIPARKAFQIGRIKKEIEEKLFSIKPE